ncbi:MAG TPA: DNA-directed RNA polymerase subunit alpha C-terminal domain-containing protein, partial [Candidatus Dojkabacteria bacterium]|nr:DNA-directed RNA polymerase subunit alpha C-terminal domain-containing protein [Candidatus Dojkabacteria bacterium]
PRTLKLKINGKKGKVLVIKAADFEVPSDVEIVNQDLEIATLTKDVKLEIDMTVEAGSGYTYANESKRQEIGVIPVDSIFSPVKRVKVEVVKARVGQITNLDQINLEVYTNGAISPTEALLNAAEMYDRLSNRLVELLGGDPESLKAEKALEVKEEEVKEDKILISDLNLSTRLTNSLLNSGITDLRDLVKKNKEEVSNFRGMGKKSMTELEEIMENHGLSFS